MRIATTLLWIPLVLGCKPEPTYPTDTDTDTDTTETLAPRSCDFILEHTPETPSLTVEVAGEFSDWEPIALEDSDEDGIWTVSLGELAPGEYGHKFIYGGLWEESFSGVQTHWVDNVENRNLHVGDCTRPRLTATSVEARSDGTLNATLRLQSA